MDTDILIKLVMILTCHTFIYSKIDAIYLQNMTHKQKSLDKSRLFYMFFLISFLIFKDWNLKDKQIL